MAVATLFAFVGCKKKNESTSDYNSEETTGGEEERYELIEDSDPKKVGSSAGLEFNDNTDGSRYVEIGTCVDADVVIGEAACVSDIGSFYNCATMKSIKIPSTVKKIWRGAFSGCSALESITIPNGVLYLGESNSYNGGSEKTGTFLNCSSLKSVDLPGTLIITGSEISEIAFEGCNSELFTEDGNGGVYVGSKQNPYQALIKVNDKADITAFTVNENCKYIGSYAFQDCAKLTSVIIPAGVKGIGSFAFDGCKALTRVDLPVGLTGIGTAAFRNSGLEGVAIPSSVKAGGQYVFSDCKNLKIVAINGDVDFGSACFEGCGSLYSAVFEEGVSEICDKLFAPSKYNESKAPGIVTVTLPTTLKKIGEEAFRGCSSLTAIGTKSMFADNNTARKLPDGVTSIGANAFSGCNSVLFTLNPNSTARFIGDDLRWMIEAYSSAETYDDKYHYAEFKVQDGCYGIADGAFDKCVELKTLTIPASVKHVGKQTVVDKDNIKTLKTVNYVDSETGNKEKATVNGWAQVGGYFVCPALGSSAAEGKDQTQTLQINGVAVENIDIDGNIEISDYAFAHFDIKTAKIGNGVTELGAGAFYGCTKLASVEIGDGVAEIGAYTFYGANALTSVALGKGVKNIGEIGLYGVRDDDKSTLNKVVYNGELNDWVQIKGLENLLRDPNTDIEVLIKGAKLTEAKIDVSAVIEDYVFYNFKDLKTLTIDAP